MGNVCLQFARSGSRPRIRRGGGHHLIQVSGIERWFVLVEKQAAARRCPYRNNGGVEVRQMSMYMRAAVREFTLI